MLAFRKKIPMKLVRYESIRICHLFLIFSFALASCEQAQTQLEGEQLSVKPTVAAEKSNSVALELPTESKLDGNIARLVPNGPHFSIPESWLQSARNFSLNPEDLAKAKNSQEEWNSEYAKIANLALPFKQCAFCGGSEPWIRGGHFNDLQMRAYTSRKSVAEIRRRLVEVKTTMQSRYSGHGMISTAEENQLGPIQFTQKDEWLQGLWSFDLFYYDYGGSAQVEVWLKSFDQGTAVLVFMHTGGSAHKATIAKILSSLNWK